MWMRGLALMTLGLMLMGFTVNDDYDLADRLPVVTPIAEGVYGAKLKNGKLMAEYPLRLAGTTYHWMAMAVTFYPAPEPPDVIGVWRPTYVVQVCKPSGSLRC